MSSKWKAKKTGEFGAAAAKDCHTGNSELLKVGKGTLFIGGLKRGAVLEKGLLVLDMTEEGQAQPPLIVRSNRKGAAALPLATTEKWPWVNIPTRDFSIPTIGAEAWAKLAAQLRVYMEPGNDAVIVCFGGHGRSGLAAAILVYLLDPKPGCPVERVRLLHCKNAVETPEQLAYVARMTGVAVTAKEPNRWHAPKVKGKTGDDDKLYRSGDGRGFDIIFGASSKVNGLLPAPTQGEWNYTQVERDCSICTQPTQNASGLCDECEDWEGRPGF